MYAEYDEGLGGSPISESFQRDYPTFIPDGDDYSHAKSVRNASENLVFPQKLDLSLFPKGNSKHNKSSKRKKWSPIKEHHDSAVNPRKTRADVSSILEQTVDLDSFRREVDELAANVLNASMRRTQSRCSSVTSDRAPSVSSNSTFSQRSLSIQIKRAKELVDKRDVAKISRQNEMFADSEFHLTTDDETRPPSSQASLTYEVDRQPRTSDVITVRHTHSSARSPPVRHAATSTSVVVTDTFLRDHYDKRRGNEENEEDDEEESLIEGEKTFVQETPILTSCSTNNSGFKRIEVGRNAASSTIGIGNSGRERPKKDTILHHSFSSNVVRSQRAMPAEEHVNRSLPNLLDRFVVKPSTREIFNTPLDIDAICGKGLRKNKKSSSSDRHFSGAEAAESIHGSAPKPLQTSRRDPLQNLASRPTTSSNAKRREPSQPPPSRLPYCSVTQTDGIPYSLATVSQQLLGTVKSLHPDWLPMTRRLLNNTEIADVAEAFSKELRKIQMAVEAKFARNQHPGLNSEEIDANRAKLCVIFRILERIEELRSRGGHYTRIHQIKLIHNALLSA